MDETISFNLNGQAQRVTTDATRPLLDVLREELHLTGAKYGCGETQCGACSVLVEGKRVFSCVAPIKSCAGKNVITVEGLAGGGGDELHPVQQAFLDEGAYQCGYCISGMIVAAVALLKEKQGLTEEEIVAGMNKNLCRCCGYPKILNAVKRAAGLAGR